MPSVPPSTPARPTPPSDEVLLAWVEGTLPAFERYIAEYQQWAAISAENQEFRVLQEEVKKVKIGDIQEYATTFDYFLPKEYRPQEIVLLLRGFVRGSGAEIDKIAFSREERAGTAKIVAPLGVVKIDLTLRGSYDEIRKFLNYLETSGRIFDTGELSIKKERGALFVDTVVYGYFVR